MMSTQRLAGWMTTVVLGAATLMPAHGSEAKSDWFSSVGKTIEAAEYEVSWQPAAGLPGIDAAFQAPNRAHGFRTYFTPAGIRAVPRAGPAPSWEWGLRWIGYGRGGTSWTTSEPTLAFHGARVEYARRGVSEWYVNGPEGLEQGFTLQYPPEKLAAIVEESELLHVSAPGRGRTVPVNDLVHLELALEGSLSPEISADGLSVDFIAPSGARTLRYSQLRVADANGRTLASWIEGFSDEGGRGVRLVFDARDAVFPITIDPLTTNAVWMAESDQESSLFGEVVASAGDVNGDGYADLIVGADEFDGGETDEGRVFLFLGSPSGLAVAPAWTAEGNQSNANFGSSVATAGDVNGDGYSDVIIGAPYFGNGETWEGRALVYHGSPAGLAAIPAWMAESDQAGAYFGHSVGTAGDVNGDGFADVIVGAPHYDGLSFPTNEGTIFVYYGSASGLGLSPGWTRDGPDALDWFGWSVGTAGDVNGDGYADVIVGAPSYEDYSHPTDSGLVGVYYGSASGSSGGRWIIPTVSPYQYEMQFGWSVGTAGDVDGDGYSDAVVGTHKYDFLVEDQGGAFLYRGSAAGIDTHTSWTAVGAQSGGGFGYSVATAGDVNGDGYSDVIVGEMTFVSPQFYGGRAYVYAGSAGGLEPSAAWIAESDQSNARFGCSVAAGGDVNGDGYADVAVGASAYDNGQADEGRAFVYHGSAAGLRSVSGWSAEADQASASFGLAVGTAGDVNGDGYADVIVGAPDFDGGQADEGRALVYLGAAAGLVTTPAWSAESDQAGARFGYSVGTAGDVNGDGYSEVVVGAYQYDAGQTDEGRAFVYQGSPSGLAPTPAWTAESNQASAFFGRSVGSAGDVNCDGFADLIVGAYGYDNGQSNEGRAYVYLGAASGLSPAAGWTAESDQANAYFGRAVATAGDVNGDGCSDVIVGAYGVSSGDASEGRAYVFTGNPAGLAGTPAWTRDGNQASANFGLAVGSAGDVNGDGYSDIIVGAPSYDLTLADEGRAYVYLGSSQGPGINPVWTMPGGQAGANFGYAVGGAGDVNADGFADVVVGAWFYDDGSADAGRALVYHGTAAGLGTSPSWIGGANQGSAFYGASVGTAGDVNGDGYADLLVGAYAYDSGETNEGRAFLYYGGGGRGLSMLPRQRRSDDALPIARLGSSGSSQSFRIDLLGRTPFGRGKVKLERDLKPLGQILNGRGTFRDAQYSDTGTAGIDLTGLSSELQVATPYHWRARLRYDPVTTPFAQRSRWISIPWGGVNESMLRTSSASAAGRVPDGTTGAPLTIAKAAGSTITLSWNPSCVASDSDYEVYEGTIGGDFTNHTAKLCTTAGVTTATLLPASASSYYLIVPTNGSREGSYGLRSGGVERPAASDACTPAQEIGGCP